MAAKRTAVTLDDGEVERLRRIIAERDEEGALEFVRDVLEERVKETELPHCVPFFDVGYNPGQADHYG